MKKQYKYFWVLGWSEMEKRKREIFNIPNEVKIDTWVAAEVGELCINDSGRLDEVKEVFIIPSNGVFKALERVRYVHSKKIGSERYLVTVKKGKSFKRWGKIFNG